MAATPFTINFSQFDGPLFSGRERGESARKKVGLDAIDCSDAQVNVIMPKDLLTVTSSFFLGMFDKSILHCGTKDKFFEKFHFIGVPTLLNSQFVAWAGRVLAKNMNV